MEDWYSLNITSDTSQMNSSEWLNNTQTVSADCGGYFRFILYGVLCSIVSLLGFIGNGISFVILLKDQSSPVASFLLQALAIADNSFLVLWSIHYSLREYIKFSAVQWPMYLYIRMYTFPLLYMAQMETIWLTVVIALNRFMAVCMPYSAPKLCTIYNVYKEVAVVTVFSIVYNIPKFFERQIKTDDTTKRWIYTKLGENDNYVTVYNNWLYYIFTFILPLLILGVINTMVIVAYRKIQKRKETITRKQVNDNSITLVMIMVVLVFMLCQGPARVVQLVYSYTYPSCTHMAYYAIHISNTFEVFNSALNFFIYYIFRKRFRDLFASLLCSTCGSGIQQNNIDKSMVTEGYALTEKITSIRCSEKPGQCGLLNNCTSQGEIDQHEVEVLTENNDQKPADKPV